MGLYPGAIQFKNVSRSGIVPQVSIFIRVDTNPRAVFILRAYRQPFSVVTNATEVPNESPSSAFEAVRRA